MNVNVIVISVNVIYADDATAINANTKNAYQKKIIFGIIYVIKIVLMEK